MRTKEPRDAHRGWRRRLRDLKKGINTGWWAACRRCWPAIVKEAGIISFGRMMTWKMFFWRCDRCGRRFNVKDEYFPGINW